ncbi:DUF3822 family protein [Flavobacteriales bacterium]|nr:DUF3822 family protein [Flavobacteriales bacterium]
MVTGNKKSVANSIIEASFDFVDDSYTESLNNHAYHLSIELDKAAISFAVLHLAEKKYVRWGKQKLKTNNSGDELEAFKSIVEKFSLLQQEFKSSSIACAVMDTILIPEVYYQKDKEQDLLQYNFGTDRGVVMRDKLFNVAAYQVYDLPKKWVKFIDETWPKISILHQSTILIEQVVVHSKTIDEITVFAHLQNNKMNLIIADNGKLLFSNRFQCLTKEDVAYFVLATMEQLEIRNYEIRLTMSGETDHSVLDLLSKYVKTVDTVKKNEGIEYSSEFGQPIYRGYSVFSQYLCG